MSSLSPEHVIVALADAESEWPELVGEDWTKIEPQYRVLRDQLEDATGAAQMRVAAELVQLLAPYAAARERLNESIEAQTEAGAMVLQLADLAKQLGLDHTVSEQIRNAAHPSSSQRIIWQPSPTKATSLKLANVLISFEFGIFSEFLAGLITTAIKDVIGEANGALQAAGALLMIASLYKATTIKLDEREATVFYGFAKAGYAAKEDVILAYTNQVRQAVSLKPLGKQELGNALHKLAEFRSIERVKDRPDLWLIIENHKAKHLS
jgi:hypothetical protein